MFHFPIDAVTRFLQKLTFQLFNFVWFPYCFSIKLTKEQLRPAQHFQVNNFGRPTAKYALECTICKRLWDPKNIANISKTKDEGCSKYKSDHGQSIAENFSDLVSCSTILRKDFTKRSKVPGDYTVLPNLRFCHSTGFAYWSDTEFF